MPLFLARFRSKATREEVSSYFKHLKAEHEILGPVSEEYEPRIQEVITKGEANPEDLTWDDLLDFEILLLHVLPPDKLERKSWMIRERYYKATGRAHYAEYLRSKPPLLKQILKDDQIDKHEENRLRADLEVLLQNLYWRHRLNTIWERARTRLFGNFGIAILLIAVLGAATTWGLYQRFGTDEPWKAALTLTSVVLAGVAGAFVSLLKRLDAIPSDQKRTMSLIRLANGSTALIAQSVLTGGIFALLLLLMFGSGLLTGELFPQMEGNTILLWLAGALASSTLFAKVILWSFVAGFAERLVPDLLDTLAKKPNLSESAEPKVPAMASAG